MAPLDLFDGKRGDTLGLLLIRTIKKFSLGDPIEVKCLNVISDVKNVVKLLWAEASLDPEKLSTMTVKISSYTLMQSFNVRQFI